MSRLLTLPVAFFGNVRGECPIYVVLSLDLLLKTDWIKRKYLLTGGSMPPRTYEGFTAV